MNDLDRLPDDPFESSDDAPLGLFGEIMGEAALLADALREACTSGTLLEAVWALDESDLRVLVIERILTEAFRNGLRRGEGGR